MIAKSSSTVRRINPRLMRFGLSALLLTLLTLTLSSCFPLMNSGQGSGAFSRDAILLWHNLEEPNTTALNNVLDRYRRANPDVDIIVQQQGPTMEEEYIRAVRSGLGPNILLSSSSNVRTLADAGSLMVLDGRVSDEVMSRFLSVAVRTLRYNGSLYGLPMAIDTQVLFFNRQLVERPAATVDQLLQEASAGQRVLMNSQFTDALWSARTFGVDLFDAEGNPQDTTGGIANWLTWMEQVRDIPGFIIDDNAAALRDRFLRADIPYYIGHSFEINQLNETLGADLGVAQLPSGPAGGAGPLLTTSALLINAMSSERQIELALDLAQFVSSSDQQAALMREANIVPANTRTRISEGLYPRIATVTAQARTALPFTNEATIQDAFAVLASAYNRTMSGVASATEAALEAQAILIEEYGFPGLANGIVACYEQGDLMLLVPNTSGLLTVVRTLIDGFADVCPGINIMIKPVESDTAQDLLASRSTLLGVDLLLTSNLDLPILLDNGVIAPITDLLDPALVQQMRPLAVTAMRFDGQLYGAPVMIDMQTLYYNAALINDAAGTLADLRAQAQGGVPVLLDASFEYGFWGVGAFGGRLYTDDGQFGLSPSALIEWLTWLQESQQTFSIRTTPERNEVNERFVAGESVYLVTSSLRFNELLAQFRDDSLGVALFPQGSAGPGRPLTSVAGLVMVDGLTTQQTALASRFLNYVAGVQAQTELLFVHRVLPVNSAVPLERNPSVARMVEQLQSAVLLQYQPWLESVFTLGDQAYANVLANGMTPSEAVTQMYAQLEADAATTGIVVPTPGPTPAPTATPIPTEELTPFQPFAAPTEEETPEGAEEGSVEDAVQEGVTP
jgi:maltose-binding protein MalE